jgi:hypothetical protein
VLLSDTPWGQLWLNNFALSDRATASLLLDALQLVGQDALRDGLLDLISGLPNRLETPIALVPVRALAPGQFYFPHGRNSKPRLLLPQSLPGSEAVIANILTSARRVGGRSNPFVSSPSLANMRAARCRTILLVDDFSGSGDQILRFWRGFKTHPTLRSWLSYHRITHHVAVFGATETARKKLERAFGSHRVHIHRMCPTIYNRGWEAGDRQAVIDLCERYRSTALETPALGHGGTGGLLAMSHSASNNLPVILWQEYRAGYPGWQPFFLDRGVPDQIRPLFTMTDDERRRASALRRLGQQKLEQVDWTQLGSAGAQKMFLVLAAAARRPRDRHAVADFTGLSLLEARMAIDLCIALQLLDRSLHLTDRGRAELHHARKIKLPIDDIQLNGTSEPYYPRNLRVGR